MNTYYIRCITTTINTYKHKYNYLNIIELYYISNIMILTNTICVNKYNDIIQLIENIYTIDT